MDRCDRNAAWAQAYLGGKTLREIAHEAGFSRPTVNQALRKLGVLFRPNHRRKVIPVGTEETHRRGVELRKLYGISSEQYNVMLAAQGGHCAVCPATSPGRRRKYFCVDHDHATGAVRGLLCNLHNILLGQAGDSVEVLRALTAYLESHRASA